MKLVLSNYTENDLEAVIEVISNAWDMEVECSADGVIATEDEDDEYVLGRSCIYAEGIAKEIVAEAPSISFIMTGIIDDSEHTGTLQQFEINYNEKLTIRLSDWYSEILFEDYDTYESLLDDFELEDEYTEDDYNNDIESGKDAIYMTDDGIVESIELGEPEIIK